MAWPEAKVATLPPQMLFQLDKITQTNKINRPNLKAKAPADRHSNPKSSQICSLLLLLRGVLVWVISASHLDTHGLSVGLCSGITYTPATKPEQDVPPAVGSSLRKGELCRGNTSHIWILPQVCHGLRGVIQPPGPSQYPSAELGQLPHSKQQIQ